MNSKRERGFSLVELMVVVAVIAILAAIAYPSYQDYVIKANRTAAQAFMMDIANKEQQYLLDTRSYSSSLTDLALSTPTEVSKYYTITIDPVTATTFTITATPITGTKQASDGALTLDHLGTKSPTDKWTG